MESDAKSKAVEEEKEGEEKEEEEKEEEEPLIDFQNSFTFGTGWRPGILLFHDIHITEGEDQERGGNRENY